MNHSCKLTEEEKKILRARFVMHVHRELLSAFYIREAEGMTRAQLAENLGIDKSVISRRLNGTSNMTLEVISDLARGMGFRPEMQLLPYEELAGGNSVAVPTREQLSCASTPGGDYSSDSVGTVNAGNLLSL